MYTYIHIYIYIYIYVYIYVYIYIYIYIHINIAHRNICPTDDLIPENVPLERLIFQNG